MENNKTISITQYIFNVRLTRRLPFYFKLHMSKKSWMIHDILDSSLHIKVKDNHLFYNLPCGFSVSCIKIVVIYQQVLRDHTIYIIIKKHTTQSRRLAMTLVSQQEQKRWTLDKCMTLLSASLSSAELRVENQGLILDSHLLMLSAELCHSSQGRDQVTGSKERHRG